MSTDASNPSEQTLAQSRAADISPSSGDTPLAAKLRGFGPLGILAIVFILLTGNFIVGRKMIVLPIGAVLVLLWVHLSRTPWHEIGYVRPKSWLVSISVGIVFGVSFKLLMKVMVMPLLGAPPINPTFHFLASNRALLPSMVWASLVAGWGEETIFRGWAFERFGKLWGSSTAAKMAIVLITSIWFGFEHYSNQGWFGAEQAAIDGLVFAIIFAFTRRLWMLMIAHAAFDLTAFAIIYCNLETRFAHFIF